jgi:hypothetical protein
VRLRSRWIAAALLGLPSFAASAPASADPPNRGVRIDQLQPASPESPFFRAEGPHNPEAEGVEFAVGLTLEYANNPLREKIVDVSGATGTTTPLVKNAFLTRIGASITPIHWLAVDLSLPIALYENGATAPTVGGISLAAGKAPGVGDLRIGLHFRPIDKQVLGLIVGGRVWAPFGTQSTYLSDGTFRGEFDIGVAGELERALYGCTVNVSPGLFIHRAGDRFAAECGGYFKINDMAAIGLEPTVELVTQSKIGLGGTANTTTIGALFEPLLAARLRFGGFRVGIGLGPGLGGGIGSADVRLLINAAYVGLGKPPKAAPVGPPDRDLDKIPDDVDACPDEAGPPNKDPKRNGCPTHDRDGDGIPDEEDSCPDVAGIRYPDPKGNGCPDTDNDGLPDPVDQCVNEPGPPPTGCPKYARITNGTFKVTPPIDFGIGEKLSPANAAALQEIAATLRANPKIDQVSISVGTKSARPATSDKRAEEILLVLRAANLDSSRYEVVLKDDLRAGAVDVRIVK